jgi:hypothetical protein
MSFQSTGLNREVTQLEVLAALQALPANGREYTVEFESYTGDDTIVSNCNEILILNRGEKTATVNGVPMSRGTQLSVSGNAGETDVTEYELTFSGSGSADVLVIRKKYV